MPRICLGLCASFAFILVLPSPAALAGQTSVNDSVVQIFSTLRYPDSVRPWTKRNPQEVSGTGVVIEGKRILTNAHVVRYASQVFVQGNGSGEKVVATVEAIGPEIDLAVLKLDDESFFDKRPAPLRTEGLPDVKDAVMVYGFPTGGSSLSITKGIVSRIEFANYSGSVSGLRIQIDAAINPGNSGGPALVNDKVIGLAFSRLGGADNIGYIIPTEEITLFLKDAADGRYDGKLTLFDELQTLENDALRAKLGLSKNPRGLVVSAADWDSPDSPLHPWDVIVKIGDHDIDPLGMVHVKENLRLYFLYYVQSLVKDGTVPLTLIRDGKEMPVQVPVKNKRPSLFADLRGRYPTYFVYGPIAFSPATSDVVNGILLSGASAGLAARNSPLLMRRSDPPKFEGEEIVIVPAPMFPHRTSKGYSQPLFHSVKDVNGVRIKNIKHLVETLRDLDSEFVTIDFYDRGAERLVFNRKEILRSTDEILTDNGVRRQMSDDLVKTWDGRKAD
jgi:S1-C subfamily serine protease